METLDFDVLEGAQAMAELNAMAYDPDDYAELSDMVKFIMKNNGKNPKKINLKRLTKSGIVKRDEMKVYLKSPNAGSTAIKEVTKNPASFFFYINDRANFEPKKKDHFDLGTFAHMAFLEPELFDKCAIEPKYNGTSKDGVLTAIRWYEKLKRYDEKDCNSWLMNDLKVYLDQLKDTCGYTIVTQEHKLIIDILKKHYYRYGGGIIPMILKGAMSEVSFYGTDADTGIDVKVRPDAFNVKKNIGVDAIISFKTTSAPTIGKFLYDSAKFQYELSEGMYQQVMTDVTGVKFNATIMIMLQTVAPYLPAVFWWSPEDLQNGKYKYRYALDTIKACKEGGLWPGFEALAEGGNYGIINMQLPEWSKKILPPVDIEN